MLLDWERNAVQNAVNNVLPIRSSQKTLLKLKETIIILFKNTNLNKSVQLQWFHYLFVGCFQ